MMHTEREQIRHAVENIVYGREITDDEFLNFADRRQALFHLVERKAMSRIPDARMITDSFLREMPEPIFDHLLVLALNFFRKDARGVEHPSDLAPELCYVSVLLWCEEQGEGDFKGTDEDYYTLIERLARLAMLEEQRRAGAYAWINRFSILARVTDSFPPRLPVRDRRTQH